jgi:hypothetical protein
VTGRVISAATASGGCDIAACQIGRDRLGGSWTGAGG